MAQETISFSGSPIETTRLLPVYILCDVSSSMGWADDGEEKPIDAINSGLQQVIRQINVQGSMGDDIRLSVIAFSTNARVILPLTSVDMSTDVPQLSAGGHTSLKAAFELLEKTIENDYLGLRDAGHRAYRPVVFAFTDGVPTGDDGRPLKEHDVWLEPLERLTSQRVWAPRVFAYGFGKADEGLLRKIVHARGVEESVLDNRIKFTSGESAAESIGRLFPLLFRTITDASEAAAHGGSEAQIEKALDEAHTNPDEEFVDSWWAARP